MLLLLEAAASASHMTPKLRAVVVLFAEAECLSRQATVLLPGRCPLGLHQLARAREPRQSRCLTAGMAVGCLSAVPVTAFAPEPLLQ